MEKLPRVIRLYMMSFLKYKYRLILRQTSKLFKFDIYKIYNCNHLNKFRNLKSIKYLTSSDQKEINFSTNIYLEKLYLRNCIPIGLTKNLHILKIENIILDLTGLNLTHLYINNCTCTNLPETLIFLYINRKVKIPTSIKKLKCLYIKINIKNNNLYSFYLYSKYRLTNISIIYAYCSNYRVKCPYCF